MKHTKGFKVNKFELDKKRVLDLMNQIENKTGKMFHEIDSKLESRIWDAIDNKKKLTFFINLLSRKVDAAS